MTTNLNETFAAVQAASRELALLSDDIINQILNAVADATIAETAFILSENEKDLARMDQSNPKYDRLKLTAERLKGIADDTRNVATLPSPLGRILKETTRPNGMKLTKISLMIGCISNIILDPLLIFGVGIFPEMGIRGAALATGLGQVFTVIVYLIAYKKCSIPVEISRKYLELNRNLDGKLYMVGIPAILNIALPSVLISFLNQILSAFSGSYVVVLGIYYKLQTFLYLPASGIVQGMRPLIGYNYGAGEIQRVKKLFGISVLLNGMIMLAGTIICFTASETLMGMFTENPETVRLGTAALQIISIGFIPSAISVTASGALEGLSKGAQSLVISLLRYIIVIIPAAYLLCHFAGADAVWNAFWICEFITAVVVGIGIKYYWNRLLQ